MLIDGISLVESSVIANSHVESGTVFPSPSLGRMFFLNAAYQGNEPGFYVYNGTAWTTGDITKITAGTGLTGGGVAGDISLAVDPTVISTKAYADTKAPLASPALTGTPTAPTAVKADDSTQIATTAFVKSQNYITTADVAGASAVTSVAGRTGDVTLAVADVSGAAPLASPALTGTPTAPTAATVVNSTQVATTAFVKNQNYATLASPALTGFPSAPTQAVGTNDGTLATTAFVKSQNYITSAGAPVQTVAGRTGDVVLTKADVGLDNVDNKSSATIRSEITSANVTTALGFTPENLAKKNVAGGYAGLDGSGKLDSSTLPAIAITDTYVVASEAAMLALSAAETGDVAVRTDLNKTFILKGAAYATLADWQELLTPTDAVLSVNGKTGTVSLTTNDIAEGANLYFTNARASSAAPVQSVAGRTGAVTLAVADVSGAAPLASPALTGTPTAPTAAIVTSTTQVATTAFVQGVVGALTTANITEGSNLYFTNARAAAAAPVQSVAGRTGAVTLAQTDISGTVLVANGGTGATSAEAAATNLGVSRINPTAAKTGDVKVAAGVISIYDGSAWKQVFPAVYA
jgi:hypothetical protein